MRIVNVAVSLAIGLVFEIAAWGQGKEVPPPRSVVIPADSTSLQHEEKLPKIDLPEYVITGNESVDLPDASKRAADDSWLSLPRATGGPGVREVQSIDLGGVRNGPGGHALLNHGSDGKARVGYGSFDTPFFEGRFGGLTERADFLLKASYKSSGGHVANADTRTGNASLSIGTRMGNHGFFPGNRVQALFGMQGRSYRLYGSSTPSLQRTATGFNGELVMSSNDNEMSLPYTSRLAVLSSTTKDASRSTETSLGLELNGSKEFGAFEVKGVVALWRSFYQALSATHDPLFNHLGANLGYRLENSLDVRAGFGFYLFRGSESNVVGRLYPRLGASWYVSDRLTVYARFEPTVQQASLASIVESNPYVVVDVPLRHAEHFTDFSFGAEAQVSRSVRSRLSLRYTRTDNQPVFVDPNSVNVWGISYAGTTKVVALDGGVTADIGEEDNIGASFSIRSGRNSQTGKPNPFHASFVSDVAYQHVFAFGLTVSGTLQFVGRRPVDVSGTRHLSALALLAVDAEYTILPQWTAFVELGNVFDQRQTWWEGYTGIRRTMSFGTGYTW